MASAEGKRTERISEKSLNLENSLNLRFGFPRVKRHFSYEGNEQYQNGGDKGEIPLDTAQLCGCPHESPCTKETQGCLRNNNWQ
jgi:hypothetical protein